MSLAAVNLSKTRKIHLQWFIWWFPINRIEVDKLKIEKYLFFLLLRDIVAVQWQWLLFLGLWRHIFSIQSLFWILLYCGTETNCLVKVPVISLRFIFHWLFRCSSMCFSVILLRTKQYPFECLYSCSAQSYDFFFSFHQTQLLLIPATPVHPVNQFSKTWVWNRNDGSNRSSMFQFLSRDSYLHSVEMERLWPAWYFRPEVFGSHCVWSQKLLTQQWTLYSESPGWITAWEEVNSIDLHEVIMKCGTMLQPQTSISFI